METPAFSKWLIVSTIAILYQDAVAVSVRCIGRLTVCNRPLHPFSLTLDVRYYGKQSIRAVYVGSGASSSGACSRPHRSFAHARTRLSAPMATWGPIATSGGQGGLAKYFRGHTTGFVVAHFELALPRLALPTYACLWGPQKPCVPRQAAKKEAQEKEEAF